MARFIRSAWCMTSQSAFMRGFIDDEMPDLVAKKATQSLNPRSCAASSMTSGSSRTSPRGCSLNPRSCAASSMTSQEGFPGLRVRGLNPRSCAASSMTRSGYPRVSRNDGLNPRSCAASSMTLKNLRPKHSLTTSQSAFMRGFIDDFHLICLLVFGIMCLNPRSCAASSMTT